LTSKRFKHELSIFLLLSQSGIPIKKQIELSFSDSKAILARLEKGEELFNILSSMNDPFCLKLCELARHMSLKDAATLLEHVNAYSKKHFFSLAQKLLYPVTIFFFSFLMTLFFIDTILPQMMAYIDQEALFLRVLKAIMLILSVFLGAFFLLFFYVYVEHPIPWVEKQLQKIPFLQMYYSMQFALFFEGVLSPQLSSMETLQLLSSLNGQAHVRMTARNAYQRLAHGEAIERCFCDLETEFCDFFQIGMECQDLHRLLRLYVQKKEKELQKGCAHIVKWISVLSYLSMGALVIVVYQVLLSPLSLLTTF